MKKATCLMLSCNQTALDTARYCLFHYHKFTQHNGFIPCSYCYRYQVPTNKNFYIQNRYHSGFWNTQETNKFICFSCLYDWQELPVLKAKKPTYYVYKYRYFNQQLPA